jgi:hypothetical protein
MGRWDRTSQGCQELPQPHKLQDRSSGEDLPTLEPPQDCWLWLVIRKRVEEHFWMVTVSMAAPSPLPSLWNGAKEAAA